MHAVRAEEARLSIDNSLLATLPTPAYRRLQPHCELVPLARGAVLCEPGVPLSHAYFPTTAIVSLVTAIERRASEEVAVVGGEGMIGVSLLLQGGEGGSAGVSRAVVQSAGYAYRLRAEILAREFLLDVELQQTLLCYTQALITQIAQIGTCNRYHDVAQQLSRWLLLRLDRMSGCQLQSTQQQIAELLGVRREAVTNAASDLQDAGAIRYQRGSITVLDRAPLVRRSCECYGVIGKEYARLLSDRLPRPYHGLTASAA